MYPEYKKVVFPYQNNDGSKCWVVEFPDLPGCSAVGNSEEEALRESKDASELWLDEYYDSHGRYPEPKKVINEYSGKFVLRVPKTLHKELAQEAESEGVSLNAFVVSLLSKKYGEHIAKTTVNLITSIPHPRSNKPSYEGEYNKGKPNRSVKITSMVR